MAIIRKSKKLTKSKRLRRSSRIKYLKRGGGYIARLRVNKPVIQILTTSELNNDKSLVFTITNQTTHETINYTNIRCLGEGTYGKVFLISNDGNNYVIKISNRYLEYLLHLLTFQTPIFI